MTVIEIKKQKNGRAVHIFGHCTENTGTNTSPRELCNAISTLAYTLQSFVCDKANVRDNTFTNGDAKICFTADDGVLSCADAICHGFEMLAKEFPGVICTIIKNEKEQTDETI